MKRMIAASMVLAGVFAAGTANAQSARATSPINMEEVKKFQQESAELRGEMVVKKMELIGESMKEPANPEKVASVAREVVELQARIGALAQKHGLPGPSGFQSVVGSVRPGFTEAEREFIHNLP